MITTKLNKNKRKSSTTFTNSSNSSKNLNPWWMKSTKTKKTTNSNMTKWKSCINTSKRPFIFFTNRLKKYYLASHKFLLSNHLKNAKKIQTWNTWLNTQAKGIVFVFDWFRTRSIFTLKIVISWCTSQTYWPLRQWMWTLSWLSQLSKPITTRKRWKGLPSRGHRA